MPKLEPIELRIVELYDGRIELVQWVADPLAAADPHSDLMLDALDAEWLTRRTFSPQQLQLQVFP